MEFKILKKLIHEKLRDVVKEDDRWRVAHVASEISEIHIKSAEKEAEWFKNKLLELEEDYREIQRKYIALNEGVDINSL